MIYKAYFTDINSVPYTVEIDTHKVDGLLDTYELALGGEPIIITTNSDELFSPIKCKSCSIDIVTDGGLFDLYTVDPQGVSVIIYNRDNNDILFKGYATPMQYGQDWTTYDHLTLECVDFIASLKNIKYEAVDYSCKKYLTGYNLINWILSHVGDEPVEWPLLWEWPQVTLTRLNSYDIANPEELLNSILFNEANFFDDDDQQTPWTFYEVLEEICKYFSVTCTTYKGRVMFIDYVYAAWRTYGTYNTYVFDLESNSTIGSYSKNSTWNDGYAGGTTSIETDDLYNIVSVSTNRYDIDKVTDDLNDHKYHVSITKEKGFGDGNQVFTWTKEHFFGQDENTYKYAFKTYCYLNASKTRWRHSWYSFLDLAQTGSYYSTTTYNWLQSIGSYYWFNTPENRYINTLGATMVHYAVLDSMTNKPTRLEWNDVVMFQCAHPSMLTQNVNKNGTFMYYDMFDGTLEKPALIYTSDYEMCWTPIDGTSWLAINAKLWYQNNPFGAIDINAPQPIDMKNLTTAMFPFEDLTDYGPYTMSFTGTTSGYTVTAERDSSSSYFGRGWQMLKLKLKIGDKYWNGSQWTTTDSTFYMNFSKRYTNKQGVEYDAARYYEWMDAISNTDYTTKVGADGYCIPIKKEDAVCGQLELTVYMPMMMPRDLFFPADRAQVLQWYDLCPIVYMKDFMVDYVYTDDTEWYLNEEPLTDDLKYENDTKDLYVYEKNIDMKVNTWQRQRPISKSYPIVRLNYDGRETCEYLNSTTDQFGQGVSVPEFHSIYRNLRHYIRPTLIYNANRHSTVNPWSRIKLGDASELNEGGDRWFVVDSQEYNVRDCNNRVKLVEFGIAENTNT